MGLGENRKARDPALLWIPSGSAHLHPRYPAAGVIGMEYSARRITGSLPQDYKAVMPLPADFRHFEKQVGWSLKDASVTESSFHSQKV